MDIFLNNKTRKATLCAMAAFILFCGCGYNTHSLLPDREASIHVDNFVNKIKVTSEITDRNVYYAYRPGMESEITRAVINQFIFDGNYEIKDAKNACFLLKGELVDFKREPLRYDANENVIEYRLSIIVNLRLYKRDGDLVWRADRFAGESTYRTTGQYAKSETTAAQAGITDLAVRIVERAVENW